jgi:hypothetical protein
MYIDVRGVHPILFDGMRTFVLEGADRSITLLEAIDLIYQETGELIWETAEMDIVEEVLDKYEENER